MGIWQERGLAIANSNTVRRNRLGWQVPSQSGNGSYVVNIDNGEPFCTCQFFEAEHKKCQHIYACEFIVQRETKPDGTVTETKAMRITYTQEWAAYNEAQTHEQERFLKLLSELCRGIVQQVQEGAGRRNHSLSDIVIATTFKVYSTMSGRRAMTDLRELETKGFVAKAPSYNSISDYLGNPALTPLLKSLIEESASPLKSVETDFAIDSSGFATSNYDRWFDHKWGKEKSKAKWINAHVMCGVKTHVVTSVEVTADRSADCQHLPKLVNTTAKTFNVNEVSADKAYSTKKNLEMVNSVGATPYIPFKMYGSGRPELHIKDHTDGSLWSKMWLFYNFNQEAFMARYHHRSNVETTFAMIKAKFGTHVRSKSPTAQVNEVLCKILCHNICCLLQSICELGLEPTFWDCRSKMASDRQLPLFN